MKRRQILQAVPALAAVALLPSIAWSEPERPLPPTIKMEEVCETLDPGVKTLRGFWQPYGDDDYLMTQMSVRYRPLWWPELVPCWAPTSEAQFRADFKEKIARDYEETRLFFERTGMGFIQAANRNSSYTPRSEWVKIRGEWKLGTWLDNVRSMYSAEERRIVEASYQTWIDSGKTAEEAYLG